MLRALMFLVVFLAGWFGAAAAPDAIPDTAPGRLLKGWLESFNAGDRARLARYLGKHFAPDARRGSPRDAAERQADLREEIGGGFDFHSMLKSTPTELTMLARERSGVGWAEIQLRVDPAQPELVAAFDLRSVHTPAELRPPRASPEEVAHEVDALAEKLARADRFSGVILIAHDGKPLFQKAYGLADREQKIPVDLDTKFRLGSMNKMFTSVAIAQLVQQGKLRYTDTVAKLLPTYPDREAAAKITVHQLLTHTSGLGDFFGPAFPHKKDQLRTLADYLELFAGQPLEFEPGKGWAYSNAGMIVAGLIVERVSGQSYFDYVREHIFVPAGMKASGTWEKTRRQPNQSIGYTRKGGQLGSNVADLPLMGSSAGGGDSTAPDLLRFAIALRGYKLVSPELTELITTAKVDTSRGGKYGYGFGVEEVEGDRVVGHGGGAPGMNADLDIYWGANLVVVVLANRDPPVAGQISDLIRERVKLPAGTR